MRLAVLALWMVTATTILPGAILTYSPLEQTSSGTVNLQVTFDDAAVPGAIQGTVDVLPDATDSDTGDIRAVYFNLINLPGSLTLADVAGSITGSDVTQVATNTADLGGGSVINPLGPFSVGVEIGSPGIGNDDIQSTTFLISSPSLTLASFGAVGVRVTSIGLPGTNREGSGKFLDETPSGDDPGDPVIPEPSTYLLLSSGFAALVFCRRRRAIN